MAVAAVLRPIADASEFTQVRLSEITGISEGRVSELLGGKKAWYLEDVSRMCDALGVSVREAVERAEAIVMRSDDLSARRARKPRSRQVPVRDAARTGDRDEGEQHP